MSDSLSDSEGDSLSVDEPSLESSELTRHSSGTNTILWRRTKVVASGFFAVFSPTQLLQFREVQAEKNGHRSTDTENKNEKANIRLLCVPASCHVAFLETTNQRHTVSLTWDKYGFPPCLQ